MASKNDKEEDGPPSFRILSLPLELRRRIYRELLLPDDGIPGSTSYNLQPALLRVNKQFYSEGCDVLYKDNCWVVFSHNQKGLGAALRKLDANIIHLQVGKFLFGVEPAIQIHVCVHDPSLQIAPVEYIVVPLCDVGRVSRCFGLKFGEPEKVELSVRLAETMQRQEMHQGSLLHQLKSLRGLRDSKVIGTNPSSVGDEIATLMMTPIKDCNELYDYACEYQRRGDKALSLGLISDAKIEYIQGNVYTQWLLQFIKRKFPDASPAMAEQLVNKSHELILGKALSYLKEGEPRTACGFLLPLTGKKDAYDDVQGITYYYLGFAMITLKEDKSATSAFLQAIMLWARHKVSHEELDTLKERVNKVRATGKLAVRVSLASVLTQVRRQRLEVPTLQGVRETLQDKCELISIEG